jgi:succinate dehydrogenase / fumarate reductase cytochrome b subunit
VRAGAPPIYAMSIGKKVIMAASGLILLGFVIVHMLGNLHTFQGAHPLDDYADGLRRLGEPILPRSLLLWIVRVVLSAAFVAHVYYAIELSVKSRRARQNRYVHPDHVQADVPAVTMRWGGVAIGLFVIFHLANYTWGWIHPNYTFVRGAVYHNTVGNFDVWWITAIYLAAMVALCLHIYHGAWSMFQTFGLNNRRWDTVIRRGAGAVAVVVFLGFISVPVAVLAGLVS